jgi:beta-glucanase (GH16 family)
MQAGQLLFRSRDHDRILLWQQHEPAIAFHVTFASYLLFVGSEKCFSQTTFFWHTLREMKFLALLLSLITTCPLRCNAQCLKVEKSKTGAVSWTPKWCDEFNGAANSPIDRTNWAYDTGDSGFGNDELETYCDPSSNAAPCSPAKPNARIDGSGHLAIQVLGPSKSDCTPLGACTSARLRTQGLQVFHSGRIEARMQIPSYTGLWPAFWLLGSQAELPWPKSGESDIMETWPATSKNAGPGATGNCSTAHTQITGDSGKDRCFTLPRGERIDDAGGHTYGQIWSANMIQYYIDDPDRPYFVVTASDLPAGDWWPFSSSMNPFFIILNIAVGGTLGDPTDSGTSSQPPMLVDYVRQYVPSPVVTHLSQPSSLTLKAGATTANTASITITQAQGTGRTAFSCTTAAPNAGCLVTTGDSMNKFTADFSNTSSVKATTAITTTANTDSNGTTPGTYPVTVNAYNVSSSDAAKPSVSTTFSLNVK